MNRLFTLALAASLALPVLAGSPHTTATRHSAGGLTRTVITDRDGNIIDRGETRRNITASRADGDGEETPVTIKIKFVYPDGMEPVAAWHGSQFWGECAYYEGEDEVTLELGNSMDAPNNFVTAEFTRKGHTNNSNNSDRWIVFKELDAITDGMTITFDAAEATDAYIFKPLNPQGEALNPSHFMINVDTDEFTLLESGNIEDAWCSVCVYDKSGLVIADSMFNIYWRSYSDGRPERKYTEAPTFFLNELPEGMGFYGISRACVSRDETNLNMLVITTPNVRQPGIISNNPADYAEVVTSFMPDATLAGAEAVLGVNVSQSINGWISKESQTDYDVNASAGEMQTCRAHLCISHASMQGYDVMQGLYNTALLPPYSSMGITSPYVMQEDAEPVIKHVNITFGNAQQNLYVRTFRYWDDSDLFGVMNDKLPASPADYDYILGNCAPLLVSLGAWPEANGPLPAEYIDYLIDLGWFGASYCGRAGESLLQLTQVGEVVQSVEGQVMTFDINVDGAPVDGTVQSANTATMTCNIDKADWVPPTAQLLWFTDGPLVTDHFETPANGVLNLYAADFRYTLNDAMDKDMMEAYPLESVKVEYAPHGSCDFEEIAVAENPDMFAMPGYGYCFQGSLAGVDRPAPGGWMDLKITLADDSGNVQTQTLSPAFRVESLAGVGNALADDVETTEDGVLYDLHGRRAAANPAAGIYLRRSGDRVEKIAVR